MRERDEADARHPAAPADHRRVRRAARRLEVAPAMSRPPLPRRPATERWIAATSSAACSSSGGSSPGNLSASIVLPTPGSPDIARWWPPAAASSRAARAGAAPTAHVDEVRHVGRLRVGRGRHVGQQLDVGDVVAARHGHQPGEGADADHLEAGHERGLVDVGRRHHQPSRADRPGRQRRHEGAAYGADLAVEAELAHHDQLRDGVGGHLAAGGEQGDR